MEDNFAEMNRKNAGALERFEMRFGLPISHAIAWLIIALAVPLTIYFVGATAWGIWQHQEGVAAVTQSLRDTFFFWW